MISATTLVERLFDAYVAGRDLPLIAGGDGTATPAPTPAGTTTETAPDLGKLVADAIAKAGDPTAALKSLVADNYALRDDLKAAKSKLPVDGALVLTGDDAKEWGTYRTLGKPGDVKKALDEGATFKTKATAYEREKHHAAVAEVAGYKAPVLDRLAATENLTLVIREETDPRTQKPVKVAHVQGEGDKTTPLSTYAEANWKDFLPALKGVTETQARSALNGTPGANAYRPAPKPAIAPEQGQRRRVNVL